MLAVGVVLTMSSLLFGFRQEFISKTVNASAHIRITTETGQERPQPALLSSKHSLTSLENIKPPDLPEKIRSHPEILASLRRTPEIVAISPAISTNVILQYGAVSYPATALGIVPEEENKLTGLYEKATDGNVSNLKTQDKGLAMGKTIAEKLGLEVGNTVRLTARDGNSYLFRLVAVVSTGVNSIDASRLWLNLKDAQTIAGRYNEISEIGLKISDFETAESFATQLGARYAYRAEPWQETNANILSLLVIIFANIYFVLGGLIVAAGFGIFNVFAMSVIDRQRDLAILQAVGVGRIPLVQSFLVQGILVGLIGSLAGLLLGQLLIEWLASLSFGTAAEQRPVSSSGFNMLRAWWLYAGSLGLGLFLSIISALLPAWRAGKINPVEVIRGG
jgi:lipoprotein-releasing system permease protein